MRENDSDDERRLWAYVTIGHPITSDESYNMLSYLSKIRDLDGDGIPEIAIGCADSVVAVDGQNGRLIWKTQASTIQTIRTISHHYIIGDADYIVVRSFAHGHLSLLAAVDGKVLWNRSDIGFGFNAVIAPDLYGDEWEEIFVDSYPTWGEGEVACISGATGYTIWTKNISSVISMALVKSSLGDVALAIASGDGSFPHVGNLSLLNARTHEVI